jgi:AcrR family transcriptional regulator
MPRLWNDTIETQPRKVRDAILETTAALVAKHGLRSVTMSQIAEDTGIGRATLYKYFPGVEEILLAWYQRQIAGHLEYPLWDSRPGERFWERLEAALEAYALISHESHGDHDTELAAFLHRDQHVDRAQRQVHELIRDLLIEDAGRGDVRDDVAADERASYCLHAPAASSSCRLRRRSVGSSLGRAPPPGLIRDPARALTDRRRQKIGTSR